MGKRACKVHVGASEHQNNSNSKTAAAAAATTTMKDTGELTYKKVGGKVVAVNMDDVFVVMKRDVNNLTRGAFTSRAYDSAKRRMGRCGATPKAAGDFARLQLAKAREMWKKLK